MDSKSGRVEDIRLEDGKTCVIPSYLMVSYSGNWISLLHDD